MDLYVLHKMKLLQKSNIVGALCLIFFALSFVAIRPASLGTFDFGAMVFWGALAWMLWTRPKSFGLVAALLAFGSVFVQFHFTRVSLAEVVEATDVVGVRPEFWMRFWLSVSPLIFGSVFSLISFWASSGSHDNSSETGSGEQGVAPQSTTRSAV